MGLKMNFVLTKIFYRTMVDHSKREGLEIFKICIRKAFLFYVIVSKRNEIIRYFNMQGQL